MVSQSVKLYCVKCSLKPLNDIAVATLASSQHQPGQEIHAKIWIPVLIMDCIHPGMGEHLNVAEGAPLPSDDHKV